MCIPLNPGYEFRTRVAKGDVGVSSHVSVTGKTNYRDLCTVEDCDGNLGEYLVSELVGFGVLTRFGVVFDVVSEAVVGTSTRVSGRMHVSPNVRSTVDAWELYSDCLYCVSLDGYAGYRYGSRRLEDSEVVSILLDEVLYGFQPNLQSRSMVSYSTPGIVADGNYRNGNYHLVDGKDYTVTWCFGTVKIREGSDGGWYPGSKAMVRTQARRMMGSGGHLLGRFLAIAEIIEQSVRDSGELFL